MTVTGAANFEANFNGVSEMRRRSGDVETDKVAIRSDYSLRNALPDGNGRRVRREQTRREK